MRRHAGTIGFVIALVLGGCATPPTPIMPADIDYDPEAYVTPPATPLVESPPVEPVEPVEPPTIAEPAPAVPAPGASPAPGNPVDPPAVAIGPPPTPEPTEDQQMIALLEPGRLQRLALLHDERRCRRADQRNGDQNCGNSQPHHFLGEAVLPDLRFAV